MSETLLCILLATSSAKGSNLVYHWPPSPTTVPRLARPLPTNDFPGALADNPWRAANSPDTATPGIAGAPGVHPELSRLATDDDSEYYWQRPRLRRDRSVSFTQPPSHPTSRRASPSKEPKDPHDLDGTRNASATPARGGSGSAGGAVGGGADEYGTLLGYSGEFLAQVLCPQDSMCHQKFELIVDDLAFVGHPVCAADANGGWVFPQDAAPARTAERGRGSKKGQSPSPPPPLREEPQRLLTPERQSVHGPRIQTQAKSKAGDSDAGMQTFHFVVVLDLPDPSSSASGNIAKYFDTIYEQVAFNVTAVLYQEQVLNRYVEAQSELLSSLREDFANRGESFADFMYEALTVSTIAPMMKTLYESIKANTIARVMINDLPLELQLPPYLDTLLHPDEEVEAEEERDDEYGEPNAWGPELSFAWRLPALTPWKALLRLDDGEGEEGYQLYMHPRATQLNSAERELAEQLLRFLGLASVSLSLAEMSSLLDLHLESQIYPAVRWLVQHRRVKIVDVVHLGLKTVFSVPQKFPAPLATLSEEFSRTFANVDVPPLPKLLAMISSAPHKQSANHFFATVVGTKDLIPVYNEVVLWMLKRDLLIRLHLRIRIIATEQLKRRVREQWEERRAHRRTRSRARSIARGRGSSSDRTHHSEHRAGARDEGEEGLAAATDSSPGEYWISLSPKTAHKHARQTTKEPASNEPRERSARKGEHAEKSDEFDEDMLSSSADDEKWVEYFRNGGSDSLPSMISDPARATPLERRWLAAMCEGKDPHIAARFERIHQYFDGKCSDDEILYRAEISRRQLREVLHQYDEYVRLVILCTTMAILTAYKSCKRSSTHHNHALSNHTFSSGFLCTQPSNLSAFEQSKNPFLPLKSFPSFNGTLLQYVFHSSSVSSWAEVSGATMKNRSCPPHLPSPSARASKNASAAESSWT
ncbi:nitrogen permease regulator of amino acid transport activity 3-domain-containing protein [Trametes gibbosa]|nr:nitrogen permease regulator of amino acid transport activity 3-domain-containing protein [Trametes gibbosa]